MSSPVKPDKSSRSWGTTVLQLMALLAALSGCAGPTEVASPLRRAAPGLGSVLGDVITDSAQVVPSNSWIETDQGTFWNAAAGANFLVLVQNQTTDSLQFALEPDDMAAARAIRFSWKGSSMSQDWLAVLENELRIEIPAAELSPGLHVMSVRTDGSTVPFRRIGARLGDTTWQFTADQRNRMEFLWRFLSLGVSPAPGIETVGGFLLKGPGSVSVGIVSGRRLSCRLGNISREVATFRVPPGGENFEWSLAPGEYRDIDANLGELRGPLVLEVSGSPDGYFHWGAPFIAEGDFSRPPIVLITLDTTRKDSLGVYGARSPTPNLDRFAGEAAVFENAITVSPWTLPAHASMMTGLYPSNHGGGVESLRFPVQSTTLAELLSNAGYMTVGFAGGMLTGHDTGLARGFLRYRTVQGLEVPGEDVSAAAAESLSRIKGDSFFLFANYFAPHFPHVPRREFGGSLEEGLALLPDNSLIKRLHRGEPGAYDELFSGEHEVDSESAEVYRIGYAAEVATMDADVGRLLDSLRESGVYDRTLIIVVGDHGELIGEDGHFGHAARLDPGLAEVPLIIKWPGQTEGVRDTRLVSVVDLFATILEVARLAVPENDGVSLANESVESRPWVVLEEHHRKFHTLYPAMKIADDVYELRSAQLRQTFWNGGSECRVPTGDNQWEAMACSSPETGGAFRPPPFVVRGLAGSSDVDASLTPEQKEKLRALGYLR